MAPTNIKAVHQTSLLHIESNLDRLGMLQPTHDQRSQQKNGKLCSNQFWINKSKFLNEFNQARVHHLKLGIEPESWLQSHELGF